MKRILFYLKFGNKNMWRRKSRTLLLGFALSTIALFGTLFSGVSLGVSKQMIGGAIQNFLGNVVFYHEDSLIDPLWPQKLRVFDSHSLIGKLNDNSDISCWGQLRTQSIIYSDSNQQGILLIGVERDFKSKIDILEGDNLNYELFEENQILITKETADKLNVNVADFLTVEVVTEDGVRNLDYFYVSGIYQILGVSQLFSGHMAIMPLNQVQMLINEDSNKVTEVMVTYNNDAYKNKLEELIKELPLKNKPWNQYGTIILSVATAQVVSIWIIWGLTMVVVLVFLFDTFYAIVEERRRQFGTMISLGLSNRQLSAVFLGEIVMLILYFVIPGFILGSLVVWVLGHYGIPIQAEAVRVTFGGFNRLYPFLRLSQLFHLVVTTCIFIIVVSLGSTFRLNKKIPTELLK